MLGLDLIDQPSLPRRVSSRLRARGRVGHARADRTTAALALVALATAGTVLVGEAAKLARRRAAQGGVEDHGLGPDAVWVAGQATHDALSVARAGYGSVSREELVLFNMLSGFVLTFAIVRTSTHGMREGWWPLGNLTVGDRHIHHFVPGILLAFGSGATALLTANEQLEKTLAVPFGVGVGLTFDEAALLLDLRDVYWTREGILSVQVSLALAALLGGTIMALRILRRGEERTEAEGRIPDRHGDLLPVAGGAAGVQV